MGHNQTHLTPRESARQHCRTNRLIVLPTPTSQWTRLDYFGNTMTYFSVEEEHRELSITGASEIEIVAGPTPAPAATPPWRACGRGCGVPATRETLAASAITSSTRLAVPAMRGLG